MSRFIFAFMQAAESFTKRAFVTWLSISAISGCIVILGFFIIISMNLHSAIVDLQNSLEAELFFKSNINEESTLELQEKLVTYDFVKEIEYVSKEEALEKFKFEVDEDLLEGIEENPLPSSIIVHFNDGYDMGMVADTLEMLLSNIETIESSFLPGEIMRKLANAKRTFILITIGWGIIMLFGSIIIVTNTIRLAMLSRKETIEVMKLVGADKSYIILPFVLEGIMHGFTSGFLSILILHFSGNFILKLVPNIMVLSDPFLTFLALLGLVFGVLGSRIAIARYV